MKRTSPASKPSKPSRAPSPRVVLHWHEERRRGVVVDHAVTVEHPDGARASLQYSGSDGPPAGTYKYVCSQINDDVTSRVFLCTEVVGHPIIPEGK